MDINSTLVKTIDYIVSQRINDLPIDKTVTGTIESKNEDGTYSILEGSLRFAALGNGQNYRSGQQVLVLIPGGDYSNDNKIILGLKSAMATSEQLMPYVRPRDKMIHVGKEIKELIEGQVYRNIENYYRRCNCVSVSANVKTNFAHNITEGSYGLLVHILDGEKIIETLDLNNKKDMFGNTFKFVTALPQEVTYSVDLSGVSLNGLGVKYETYIGDLYYINDNNQKVLYHPTGEEITFSNIAVSFGFDTTQKPAKELDFLLKDADTLQLLWYNMDASGKSWEFTDGEFNSDYAINYKKYQEQVNEMLILEDYSALTDEEQALFKKLYNPEKGKEAEVFDQLRKGEYKGVNPFDKIYYGVEWKITNKKESGLWKVFESDGQLQTVKPRQSKWQNTYVKAVVYRNGEIFEKVYDGVFENPIVTETSEDGHIYYTGIKLIHDQSSRPHYDCYGYTNLVTNSEDIITRKVKWSSILNEEYSIEEPPKLQPLGVYWYVPTNNTMLVPIGEKNEEKPMAGYDCYKADVFDYKIKSHFAPYDKNNTLKCRVYLDNVNYYEAELTFSFTTKGTMGTDYSLIIKEENNHAAWREGIELKFSAVLRDPEGKILYPVKDTQDQEIPNKSDISPQRPEAYPGIVSATVKINDDMQLTSYLPVAKNNTNEELYYQGPIEIIYNAFGADPLFNANQPRLLDVNGREKQDIVWYLDNQLYSKDKIPTSYTSENYYEMKVLVGKKNGATIWEQPLFLFQNLYGNSYLNKWDGKLSIDKDGGRILASMIGAGHKTNNLFTGVLMGDVETLTPTNDEPNKMTRETGIFGYSAGVQTFGVKTDGTAFLGNRNGGIQFSGDKGYISNADGSVLIDFTDDREQYKNITVSIEEGILNVSIEEIAEVDKENEEDPVKVDDSTQTVKVTTTYNCEQYYVYNQPLNNANKFTYYTDNLDSSEEDKVIITVGQENVKLSGTKNTENNFIEYSYTIDQDDQAFILKINIKSLQKSGTKTVKKTIVKKKYIGDEGEEHWHEDSALTIFEDPVYTWEKEKTSCKRQVSYSESIALSSSLKFQNGKFSFETDNFDLASKNVIFNNSAFTIKSDSRKNIALPEILNIDDKNYLFRTKDFIETSEETEITEFNIVLGAEYTWKIFKEIQNYSTIFELGTNQALAFKTAQAKGAESSLTIKSAGEAADIAVSSTRCTPGGYWVKGFIYYTDKQYFDEDGSYFGPLNTVYCYPGDNGTYLHKTNNTKIIAKKTRIKKEGITGVEFDLMNHTLKMDGGDCGDIYIGVDSSGLSNEDASGKIFIGGSKQYALRIGKFKIDWEGNVLPETAMEE